MSGNQTRDQMVDELARLLEGAPDDEALAEEHELSELVHLAQGLRDVPTATPDPAFRSRLRDQLLTEAATMLPTAATVEDTTPDLVTGIRQRVTRWRRSASLAIASALSATTIGGAGVAVAAQSAIPGDALYGVKKGIESARLAVANGDLEAGRLHLAFATERLEEIEQGIGELTPDEIIDTLEASDEAASLGANELLDAYERTGDVSILRELSTFLRDHRAQLSDLLDDLPVQAVPFAQGSLDLVRDIEVQASTIALFGDPVGSQRDPSDPGIGVPGTAESPDSSGDSEQEPSDGGSGTQDGTVEEPSELDSPLGELESPLDGLESELESPLDGLESELESPLDDLETPSLEPTLDPSLPTDAISDTIGDLLTE